MEPIIALVLVVVAIGAGFFFGRMTNSAVRNSKRLDADLKQVQSELADYKQEVSHHFEKTAELVNTMTASYRAVYEHLATGAQNLCKEQASKLAMDAPVERIANPEEAAPAEENTVAVAEEQPPTARDDSDEPREESPLGEVDKVNEEEPMQQQQEGAAESGDAQVATDATLAAAQLEEKNESPEARTYH